MHTKEHVYLGKSLVNKEDGRLPCDLINLHWCREGRDKWSLQNKKHFTERMPSSTPTKMKADQLMQGKKQSCKPRSDLSSVPTASRRTERRGCARSHTMWRQRPSLPRQITALKPGSLKEDCYYFTTSLICSYSPSCSLAYPAIIFSSTS